MAIRREGTARAVPRGGEIGRFAAGYKGGKGPTQYASNSSHGRLRRDAARCEGVNRRRAVCGRSAADQPAQGVGEVGAAATAWLTIGGA